MGEPGAESRSDMSHAMRVPMEAARASGLLLRSVGHALSKLHPRNLQKG